jgi:DNA-binding MarR family transcriptional regulator/ribosomal protein S18 acetylase RimI-like enzyme
METLVERVRRFNRTVTQRVGALDEAFLARGRSLGQCRVLWEIGADGTGGTDLRALRARLGLDSGYLSRLLRALESDGLVTVTPSDTDGRVRVARLTDAGRAERAELDRRADASAAEILTPLSDAQRTRLVGAMDEVERLLVASMVRVAACDPRDPKARFCLRSYFAELAARFDGGFDPARGLPTTDAEMTPPAGLLLVATLGEDPVGCGAVLFPDGEPAHLRRMWVAPAMRGLGLGRRLLADLEARAVEHGATEVRLETNGSLTEAIAMYRTAGYRAVDPFNTESYAQHWFAKKLPQSR